MTREELQQVRDALDGIRPAGNCWCDTGEGNPHTPACREMWEQSAAIDAELEKPEALEWSVISVSRKGARGGRIEAASESQARKFAAMMKERSTFWDYRCEARTPAGEWKPVEPTA